MGYRLRFKREALEQLDRLYTYILERNPGAEGRILRKVHSIFEHLKPFPRIGRITDEPRVHCFVVGKTGLLIFYTFEEKAVTVIRVLHERQNRT